MVKTAESPLKSKGIKGFFSNNIFVIIAFFVPALLIGISFALVKIAPFGNQMILAVDGWHQYYPFLREFQMLLKEGSLPVYSWNTGGGSDFLGVIGNYIASPLYLFTYFLPEGQEWLQMYLTFTVVVRIGCAGGFMAIFLRRVFKRNDLSLVYFSLMYALCGFVMGYYWNMMWLDTFALLPLVVAGTFCVLKDGKYSLYVVSLALSVICSFYIGYFVCIFVLLFCICYTIVNFISIKHSLKNVAKMAVYTLIAFMLTAFITVPTYMALSHSDSSADAAGFPLKYAINYAYGYSESNLVNTLMAIVRTATNLLTFTRPIVMDKGNPNIFCGVLSLVLFVFYVTSKSIKLKEKIVSLSLIVFFILSFVINQLNYIWHGMNTPAMVYYRFSFLFSFVLVTLAYRMFCKIDTISKKGYIASGIILMLYLAASFIFQRKISVAVTAVAVVVLFVGIALYRKGKIKYRLMSVLLCLFVVCEMGANALYAPRVVGINTNIDYPKQEASVNTLVDSVGGTQSEFYRTEFVKSQTLNDGALNSLFGISTFNSMCRADYSDFFTEFGLAASKGNNRYEYVESTPVTNLFLNIKYLIGRADKSTEDEAELTSQKLVDDKYFSLINEVNSSCLYENKAYVPMGFMVENELADYKLTDEGVLPFEVQNRFFSLATGISEDVLKAVDETSVSGTDLSVMKHYEDLGDYYTYKRSATEDEVCTIEYEIPETGSYYGVFRVASDESVTITYGDRVIEDSITHTHIATVGQCEKGGTVKVEIPVVQTDNGRLGFYLFKLDEEIFERGFEKLSKNSMTLTNKTSNGFTGEINADGDGLFYISVLYDEGWKAFVDGKEAEIIPIADTFCALELSAGEHEIEFVFTPQGMYPGIAVSAAGIVLFALSGLVILRLRKKRGVAASVAVDEATDKTETPKSDNI